MPILIIFLLFFSGRVYATPAAGQKIMISAANELAVQYGKDIFRRGGNVVDVAVGVGLVMAVTNPYFASLGGGGFALVKVGPDTDVLDCRETAPKNTGPEFYVKRNKNDSVYGGAAVGVPGLIKGYYELQQKYGKLAWKDLLAEPIRLAKKGFEVTGELYDRTEEFKGNFNPFGYKHFFKQSKVSYLPGEVLRQPGLAEALQLIAAKGPKEFYEGPIAQDIVSTLAKTGGVMTLDDLKNYKIRWLKPLVGQFHEYRLLVMPPPSSGGVVLNSILKLFELQNLGKEKPLSAQEVHLMSEIFHRSFRMRTHLADPDFFKNPIGLFLSPANIVALNKTINPEKKIQLQPLKDKELQESTETTHFSVMAANGDAVAMTITLNGSYGSGVVTSKYGIALNNEMDDFTTKPDEPNIYGLIQGKSNNVEPGKRPLSSMSPTIIEKDGQTVMVVGAQGGPRIISSVAQVIHRTLINNYNVEEAIHMPRVHAQFLPSVVYFEGKKWSPEVIAAVRERGHIVEEGWMGRVYAIHRNKNNILQGAHDNRVEGYASGF